MGGQLYNVGSCSVQEEEAVRMSRLFKISGNMKRDGERLYTAPRVDEGQQDSKWLDANPTFVGEIVVDKEGVFRGYCDHIFGNMFYSEDSPYFNQPEYLVGSIIEEHGGYSMKFFKLPNDPDRTPVLFEIHTTEPKRCFWAIENFAGDFFRKEEVRVNLGALAYSEHKEREILDKFSGLDLNTGHLYSFYRNADLVDIAMCWVPCNLVMWCGDEQWV